MRFEHSLGNEDCGSGNLVCVFSLWCHWFPTILTDVSIKFDWITGEILLLKAQSPPCNQWQRKHANPLTTLTIFLSQRMFKFHWCNSACLSSQRSCYLHKENFIDCLYLVTNMQWQSTIGYSKGNWHDRSKTIENGWQFFQKNLTWPFCPFFATFFDQSSQN